METDKESVMALKQEWDAGKDEVLIKMMSDTYNYLLGHNVGGVSIEWNNGATIEVKISKTIKMKV